MPARGLILLLLASWLAGPLWAVPARAATGERLTGYGDFRFGMSVAEAAGAIGQASPIAEENGVALIETPVRIAGQPALRRLRFVDDRLVGIVFRWEQGGAASADAAAQCRALFSRFHGQLAMRYGAPALRPHESPEPEPGFAGLSFWAFADGASISLIVVRDAGPGQEPCRATLNYKEPPAG